MEIIVCSYKCNSWFASIALYSVTCHCQLAEIRFTKLKLNYKLNWNWICILTIASVGLPYCGSSGFSAWKICTFATSLFLRETIYEPILKKDFHFRVFIYRTSYHATQESLRKPCECLISFGVKPYSLVN